ncbi:MAG: AEC family transporter [Candidatus Saccharibacteria bacterium]|nr:AEC family transporter [Candidatus Saccharibacteria bacterium]
MNIPLGDFYSRLGTIALILVLGYFLGKKKLISTDTNRVIVNLLLCVFMPASLFVAFPTTYTDELSYLFLAGLAAGVIVMLALILLSLVIFNKKLYKGKFRYESQFALIFNNATFLGYPIIASTFGEIGVVPYCGFIIAFNIALFSYGVYLFQRKLTTKLFREVITNPNIIAVALGVIFFVAGIKLPSFMHDAIQFTGNATTALSIICIGFMLSKANFKVLFKKWRLIVTALIQLILGPLVTWTLLTAMRFPDQVIIVCTLIQALPTATSLGLFAAKYDGNEIESSELVAVSTLLSIVTMPVMVGILLMR